MRIGMPLVHRGGSFRRTVDELVEFEQAGLDRVLVAEAYTFDSVSRLGYLAHATSTLEIGAGILNIYSRTPTLLAMTAAGLDFVSDGRFTLGLGASGPGVIEGFHGVPYDAPLARTRDVVEVCRQVWRRERVELHTDRVDIPLAGSRALKLVDHPVRERIPIVLAALGPQNVALAAELCEGWEPVFFHPERAAEAFGEALAAGAARRADDLPPLEIVVGTQLGITDDPAELEEYLGRTRELLALYLGGMGAPGRNFYNRLAARYGFAAEAARVEELFQARDRAAAAAAVPEELVRGVSLIGTGAEVAERLAAFVRAGATSLNVNPLAGTHEGRLRDVATLRRLIDGGADR